MGRNPWNVTRKDEMVRIFARRTSLDAFWSREPPTVAKNLRECIRTQNSAVKFGFGCVVPPMGPFPLDDVTGMTDAVSVLDRSLDKGIYGEQVQWETFRKTMSAVTNVSQAGVYGMGDSVGSYERKKIWISSSVSHKFWFGRFMEGLHKRVGEIRKQDKHLTIEVLVAIRDLLEVRWSRTSSEDKQTRIKLAETDAWFIVDF